MSPSPSFNVRLGLLLASAFTSGGAALAYQVLWGRQLALAFGASHLAVAAVLSAFMLGLGLGSRVGGRWADRWRDPARGLALLELILVLVGPGLCAVLLVLPEAAARLLPGLGADSPFFALSRLGLSLALLLPPTLVMGATFPVLVRAAADSAPAMHRAIARLYGANVVGGVVGVVAVGFVLLPRWGIPGAAAAALSANAAAAAAAWAARRPAQSGEESSARAEPSAGVPSALLLAAGLSGALVLAAETVWHRALLLVLANSTTTLTLLLALSLTGLGVGAHFSGLVLGRRAPLTVWRRLQLAAAVVVAVQALSLPWISHLVRLLRPEQGWGRVLAPPLAVGGVLILPATLILGAAWPLLLMAAAPGVHDGGRRIGRMGLSNSVGAAVGAALMGFAVLPAVGFGRALLVMVAGHAALALIGARETRVGIRPAAVLAIAAGTAAVLAPSFSRVLLPSLTAPSGSSREVLLYGESAAGTVVVTEDRLTGVRDVTVDNNAVIGTTYDALKVARMLGVGPTLLHAAPRQALVVGFGAGVTSAMVAFSPEVERVDVVEIVPGVVEAARLFQDFNHGVMNLEKVRLLLNDGRNHLALTDSRFDLITCDPVHPLYGSAPLYSRDFFELCRRRLRAGGVVCQYLPLHRMPTPEFQRSIATFQEVFPETWVLFGLGHAMLAGSEAPLALDWDQWRRRLREHPLGDDLRASALASPGQFTALIQLGPEACRTVGVGPPSTDLHPHLEFLAPMAYQPGLWTANARLLVSNYASPLQSIAGIPRHLLPDLRRLVAGKRLLLFSLLERNAGRRTEARQWLDRALDVAGEDPEILYFSRQARVEGW